MKIVVITGSPHRDGTSALMAREFELGENLESLERMVSCQ